METQLIKICGIQQKQWLEGNFLALNAYMRKKGTKINSLSFHLRKPEKKKQIKPKVSRSNKN